MTHSAGYRKNEVSYKVLGSGTPLYLIHGFCADGSIWKEVTSQLSENFKLVIPDLPGYGFSELPEESLSIELFADAIEAIIRKEGDQAIIIAGHSMGGYVLCELLARESSAIKKGIMVNSHPYADNEEKIKNRTKSNAFIEKNGGELYVNELYKNLFAPQNITNESDLKDKFKDIFSRLKDQTIIQSNLAMIKRAAREHTLNDTKVPIQFIIGKNDQVIELNTSLSQCTLPKIADVQILKNTGHLAMIEETEKLILAISNFSKTNFYE